MSEHNILCKEAAERHNKHFIESTDIRVQKPHVYFHEELPVRKIVIPKNWVLESDNLETMLNRPNDVAIYSNIACTQLEHVKVFHRNEIEPRIKSGFGSTTLIQKRLIHYYNYFEKIISSVIFAYTAIEALANICIPSNFEYNDKDASGNEVTMNKDEIERQFTLREKLKTILPQILGCESPSEQKWWTKFTNLENLRNEIIHSKESKSEERYSKLLSTSIIELVEIHKVVIEYFGKAIDEKNHNLIDEYPNGFGYDFYKVKTMKDENFKKSIENLKSR